LLYSTSRGFKQTDVKTQISKISAAYDISIDQNRIFDNYVTVDDVIKSNIEFLYE